MIIYMISKYGHHWLQMLLEYSSKEAIPSVRYLELLIKILDFPANSRYLLKTLIRSWIILDR